MLNALKSFVLLGLLAVATNGVVDARANDRYAPRPPILVEEPDYREMPRYRGTGGERRLRRERAADEQANLTARPASPSARKPARRAFDPAFLPTTVSYDGRRRRARS
jgi:hypothetical protein